MKLPEKLTRTFGKIGFELKKHSPEILIGVGVVGVVASAVMACRATTKINAVLEESKERVNDVKLLKEKGDKHYIEYGEKEYRKDLTLAYVHTGLDFVKLYAPSVILGALSLASIISSNNILRTRNTALAAAYATVDSSFKNYRKNVVERFGEELDRELRFNIKAKEVEETVVDENGKETKVKKTVQVVDRENPTDYAKFFDETCTGWVRDAEMNKWFLKQQQQWANDKLRAQGYLFLNDVYDMLGFNKTKAGAVVGWIYKPGDERYDSYVDFGVFDSDKEENRRFVNGFEQSVLLDFNVDGPILDMVPLETN